MTAAAAPAATHPGWHLLLLSRDPAWADAVRHELDRQGRGTVAVATSPEDALTRLVEPSHAYSHLLVEPKAAGPYLRDLVGVSARKGGSHVQLLLLGDANDAMVDPTLRRARLPTDVPGLLGQQAGVGPPLPPLSASEIAVMFRTEFLECHFQPIVRVRDRRPVGVETLVRMQHPQRGIIGPDHFIPQVERAGLSLRLTEAVARIAVEEIRPAFLEAHDLLITLNLPLDVLLLPEALSRIDAHRALFSVPVERVLIELTESRPVIDLGGLGAALDRWRAAGYRVAIDDMGPEMMHQLELFDLPFSLIKLDKEIVLRSEHDTLARRYLQRTVDNAHRRSLAVIAEGIENEAMWERMDELGVEYIQGYLVARAMPAAALGDWLEMWSAQVEVARES